MWNNKAQGNSLVTLLQARAAKQPGLPAPQQSNLRRTANNLRAAMGMYRPLIQGIKNFPTMGSGSPASLSSQGSVSPPSGNVPSSGQANPPFKGEPSAPTMAFSPPPPAIKQI
jgi:hypothetical protein